jgi:predicted Fe-Mo cluster-binding NifX family protein
MRVAITIWDNRVSPVFDTARELLVAQVDGRQLLDRRQENLGHPAPGLRVDRMRELNVDTLICGAISRPLAEMLAAAGIRVIPFVAGDADEVLAAYLNGELPAPSFAMPGCRCGQGRHFHGRRGNCGAKPQYGSQNIDLEKEKH